MLNRTKVFDKHYDGYQIFKFFEYVFEEMK